MLCAIPANFRLAPMDISGNAAIHYNLGNALAQAGRSELARREFSHSVALDSTYWQAWLNLGALQGVQGNMEAAAQIFAHVGQANPQRYRVWLNLAHAHISMGDQDAALRAYRRSLAARPEQREVYIELIQFFFGGRGSAQRRENPAADPALPPRRGSPAPTLREYPG